MSKKVVQRDFIVEKILDKKYIRNKLRYLIKWEGFTEMDNTWELIKNLNNLMLMIRDFEQDFREKEASTL